jgi:osmotically-inducible protein OsmY
MSMFGADWRDPSRYDLALNLGRMNLESAKHLILEAARREEYQPTVSSERQFQNLSLTARVHAVLITSQEFRGSILEVHAESGHVRISGNLQFWVSEEEVVRAIEGVPGVVKVTTDLGDIPLEDNRA